MHWPILNLIFPLAWLSYFVFFLFSLKGLAHVKHYKYILFGQNLIL
jgi:hypothetical protein